jgi:hypothetical protein
MAKTATQGADRRAAGQTDEFEFPPAWLPEDNERIVGVVTARERAENQYGPYIVLSLRPDRGSGDGRRIGCCRSLLRRRAR